MMRTVVQSALLLLALTSALCAAPGSDLPAQYPTEPDEAVGLYLFAVEDLNAQPLPAGSGEVRPGDYLGRAIEVQGKLAGRIVINPQDASKRWVLVRLTLNDGRSVSATSTSELKGIQDGDAVRAVLDVVTNGGPEAKFRLRAVVMEYDLPKPPAPAAATPATTPDRAGLTKMTPSPGGNLALPPEFRQPSGALDYRQPTGPAQQTPMAKFPVPVPTTPRPGVEGTWDPIGDKYPLIEQSRLDPWIAFIRKHNPNLTDRQADWIARWVIYYSALNGVDHRLMFAMIRCESDFDPFCVSRAGAVGLTQLMPCNLQDFRVVNKWNVQDNIRAGIEHFREMLDMWAGRSPYEHFALAAASYNAGPNRVKREGGIPNITETKNYVKKLGDLFYQLWKEGYP